MRVFWAAALAGLPVLTAEADFGWKLVQGVTTNGNLMTVDSSVGGHDCAARAPVDLSPFVESGLEVEIRCRGENVARRRVSWLGMKVMLDYEDVAGDHHWPQAPALSGTFDWTTVRLRQDMLGTPAKDGLGTLTLGFQGGRGKLVFDLASLKMRPASPIWPRTNGMYRISYPDRVRSLPPRRGVMLPTGPCQKKDFETLKAWGATLARYQICRLWGRDNTNRDLDEYDKWLDGKIGHLERYVLPWAAANGQLIVVDLHVPPGGRSGGEMNMFHERPYADHFVACWRRIAGRLKGKRGIFGYDLINEPEQKFEALPGCDYWNLQRRAAEAVRAVDPDATIIVESNDWDSPDAFRYLSPLAMDNVIYEVHMYQPGEFTYQGTGNKGDWRRQPWPNPARGWDRDYIRRKFAPVLAFQKRHGARIFVGEFSAILWAEGADRYLADCISVFNECGFDWTYHAFREWKGWSVEATCAGPGEPFEHSDDNARMRVLKTGLSERVRAVDLNARENRNGKWTTDGEKPRRFVREDITD